METFIILDQLGARHGTIKANNRIDAILIYRGGIDFGGDRDNLFTTVFAVLKDDVDTFKHNIARL